MEKLSSGFRSIRQQTMLQVLQFRKDSEVRSGDWNREQANKNIQDGISSCQTANE